MSLVEIKETSIRSFRQDKENYGDHFITSSMIVLQFLYTHILRCPNNLFDDTDVRLFEKVSYEMLL